MLPVIRDAAEPLCSLPDPSAGLEISSMTVHALRLTQHSEGCIAGGAACACARSRINSTLLVTCHGPRGEVGELAVQYGAVLGREYAL